MVSNYFLKGNLGNAFLMALAVFFGSCFCSEKLGRKYFSVKNETGQDIYIRVKQINELSPLAEQKLVVDSGKSQDILMKALNSFTISFWSDSEYKIRFCKGLPFDPQGHAGLLRILLGPKTAGKAYFVTLVFTFVGLKCVQCFKDIQVQDTVGCLPCGHVFHKECKLEQKNNECPICGAEFARNSVKFFHAFFKSDLMD